MNLVMFSYVLRPLSSTTDELAFVVQADSGTMDDPADGHIESTLVMVYNGHLTTLQLFEEFIMVM